jgi:hypothetical protein
MRSIDIESSNWRNDLAVRTVVYYFKTEKIVTLKEYDLKQIDLYLSLENALPSGLYGVQYGNKIFPSGYLDVMDRGFTTYT